VILDAPPCILGHRGGKSTGPDDPWPAENAMAAFTRALDEGADGIELDVRLDADGEVVVFHDVDLSRMTDGADARVVRDLRTAELKRVRLLGGAEIPLLAEVLAFCKERGAAVNVELKRDGGPKRELGRRAAEIVRRSGAEVVFSSFDPRLLAATATVLPRGRRAWLTASSKRWSVPAVLAVARRPFLFGVNLERTQIRERLVRRLRARGVHVGVWTVNDVDEARRFLGYGVSWLITDAPGRLRGLIDPRT
jgi:glycerophosphoryl diester phosphodiesterase